MLSADNIYEFLRCTLGADAYVDGDHTDPSKRIISMYHVQIGKDLQNFTLDNYQRKDCNLRLIVCTVAFGHLWKDGYSRALPLVLPGCTQTEGLPAL